MPVYESLLHAALLLVLWVTLPVIIAILVASLLVSALQSLTQINDASLSLAAHLVAAAIVIVPLGYWMLAQDAAFLTGLLHNLGHYLALS